MKILATAVTAQSAQREEVAVLDPTARSCSGPLSSASAVEQLGWTGLAKDGLLTGFDFEEVVGIVVEVEFYPACRLVKGVSSHDRGLYPGA